MTQPPTIRDVSAAAGVSTFSVSQALAGKPGVAEATRQRVLQVAADLGYLPNKVAANLKDASSRTVGVLTASGSNQYYTMLVRAIDETLQRGGYHAVSNDAMRGETYSADNERLGVQELLQQRVAAVVATYSLAEESLRLLDRWQVPVVFVDSLPPHDSTGHPFVGVDNLAASAEVANYLADLGHTDTVYLAYPPEWNTRRPREQGFVQTATGRGMKVRILEAQNSAESAQERIDKLLKTPPATWPTAIYATNIVLLQGTLKALKQNSVPVPDVMSVIGFDDFDWADLVQPPITVIDQHIADIGTAAGSTVLKLIEQHAGNKSDEIITDVLVPTELVRRSSCSPPRAARAEGATRA